MEQKKKRGRPAKVAEKVIEKVADKKRGRPAKAAPVAEVAPVAPVAKKRGRPAKAKAEPVAEVVKVVNKRGRPAKVAEPVITLVSSYKKPSSAPVTLVSEVQKVAKVSNTPEAIQETLLEPLATKAQLSKALKETAKAEAAGEDGWDTLAGQFPKRKRGRPAKVRMEVISTPTVPATPVAEYKAPAPKRGRPRKEAPVVSMVKPTSTKAHSGVTVIADKESSRVTTIGKIRTQEKLAVSRTTDSAHVTLVSKVSPKAPVSIVDTQDDLIVPAASLRAAAKASTNIGGRRTTVAISGAKHSGTKAGVTVDGTPVDTGTHRDVPKATAQNIIGNMFRFGWAGTKTAYGYLFTKPYLGRPIMFELHGSFGAAGFKARYPRFSFSSRTSHFRAAEQDVRHCNRKDVVMGVVRALKNAGIWDRVVNKDFVTLNSDNARMDSTVAAKQLELLVG